MTLIVHRASRTEVLADRLTRTLAESRPANPLAPQTVVVAHSGLRRWLLGEFARRGPRGIAANFDMILPWQWLQRIARAVLGDAALIDGAWRAESMRWHIYAALPRVDAPMIRAYLHGEDAERRRFQLADHLADIYTQYLIYRPEWIQAWEQGAERENWQARLWRTLRQAIPQPHRAQRRDGLLAALQRHGDGDTSALHVFGVSHLAPDVLFALHASSAQRAVHLYFPDPCRQYWADLKTPRQILELDPESEDLYYEVGHPLLVSLGRMGQDFFIQLDALDVELGGDEDEDAVGPTLLGAVQASIRDCAPAAAAAHAGGANDASLRVHTCHTRLRELEVLKDALLGFLADDASLQPGDIVVMAPNIAAYAPYLRAVFGEPATYADDRAHIPWHLADVGLARAHPLLTAFARVLDLPASRFGVSEIMDFLDVPALAGRFGIDADTRGVIERCVRAAHVAWGLDAAMKEQSGAAAVDQNSWSFGFDRLYAGWIVGDDSDGMLLDGILPMAGMSGGDGEAIGRLDRLLDALRRLRDGFAMSRGLLAWRDWLIEQLDGLFEVCDDNAAAAFASLRAAIARIGAQADAAGREPLPWSAVREAVRGELDKVSERQAFLLGGVTFCGLVPQRSIPFKVVCLIGMNEGEFPRQGGDAGLNLMLREPRRGDRDTRREDRYLFLEALMAARERLHISFIGEGVRDGKERNPASPLAELLQFLDAQHRLSDKDAARPWLVRHPLQPFDVRYYDRSDPQLFSFDGSFAQPEPARVRMPFIEVGMAAPPVVPAREIALHSLKRFWRDPAKAQLRDGAGLSLDALDSQTWPDREPLDGKLDRRDGVEQRLFREALSTGLELPPQAPGWLAQSGVLAAGAAGARAYAQARERARAVLGAAHATLGAQPVASVYAVELDLGDGIRLTGSVDALRRADGKLYLFGAKLSGTAKIKELLQFYIDFAAARLAADAEGFYLETEKKNGAPVARPPKLLDVILAQDRAQLCSGLRRLIELAAAPDLLFPPYTASAWLLATVEGRDGYARRAWDGEFVPGERSYTPGYAALAARDQDFLEASSPARARFEKSCRAVAAVLDPGRCQLLRDSA